jgi:hypothetical protein
LEDETCSVIRRSLPSQKLNQAITTLQNLNRPESQKLLKEKAIATAAKTTQAIAHNKTSIIKASQ